MAADLQDVQRFLDSLPLPRDDSTWDSIFLAQEADYGMLLAWFYSVFVNPQGELHQEFLTRNQPT